MTEHPNANAFHDELSAYLDGGLGPEERARVDQQLRESDALRAELADVRSAREAVRGLPERAAPDGFWDAVIANVGDDVDEHTTVVPIHAARSRRARVAWGAGAAAAAAVVIAVIVVPGRSRVRPNITAVATQHAAVNSDVGDSISSLAPVGPMVRGR
jgi:anti-sigma factor RsiW